jgi:N-methylhydantoinase A/acetophenone carboxylase
VTTIDIDTGGTFTDCLVTLADRLISQKTPTTPYDISVGFLRVIESAAREAGLTGKELLELANVIRFSTTLGLNSLIQRTGPKLGLITTSGFEPILLIGRSRQWADGLPPQERRNLAKIRKPTPLIPLDLTVGVRERVNSEGQIVIPLDEEHVKSSAQYLVDQGVRGFIVSLLWSHVNPAHELRIKEIIEDEYPDSYLGNIPVMLAHQVSPRWHEYPRTNAAVLNAYLHREMADQISNLKEALRANNYRRPLMIMNNVGGAARDSRTRALDTYGAGPIAGMFGAGYLAKLYDLPRVVASDMGGTSFDFGVLINGEPHRYQESSSVDRWLTEVPMVDVRTIGAGGGSIAWINEAIGNRLEVGPRSAGAMPGPACYDQGGTEPTVTDADVVLGLLNPDYFLGGRILLDADKARTAIEPLAAKVDLSVEQMAAAIRTVVDSNMGDVIRKELALHGYDSRQFALLAYGGAGPAHCAYYSERLGCERVIIPRNAATFCAEGSSRMDLRHAYEKSRHIVVREPRVPHWRMDHAAFNSIIDERMADAVRDMRAEGFPADDLHYRVEAEMHYTKQIFTVRVPLSIVRVESDEDAETIIREFDREYRREFTEIAIQPDAAVSIETIYLTASVPLPKVPPPEFDLAGTDPSAAIKETRRIYWPELQFWLETPVYDATTLVPGNVVPGPATIEARDTTVVVPRGYAYTLDHRGNGLLSRQVLPGSAK